MTPEEELQQTLNQVNGNGVNPSGNGGSSTPPPPPPPPPPAPEVNHDYTDFWGKSETVSPQNQNTATPPTTTGTAAPAGTTQPVNHGTTVQKVNKQAAEMSARATVSTINVLQVSLFKPLINWQFKKQGAKRFGQDNFDKGLDDIVLGNTPTDAAELARKKRINSFLQQRDDKIRAVPFNKDEEEEMIYAWRTYFEMTGKTVSPEVLIIASTLGNIGKRGIDIAIWD